MPAAKVQRYSLLAVLALQVLISAPRLRQPFVEGRSHWDYDSAANLLRAVHSRDAALSTPWDVFGLKTYAYDDQGRVAKAEQYAHHPVLPALLFKLLTYLTGLREWAPRLFGLLASLAGTALLFAIARDAGGGTLAPALLALLSVVLPLQYNYQDAWKHESVVTALALLCVRLLQVRSRRVPVALFFLVQAGWAGHLLAAALLGWMWLTRHSQRKASTLACAGSVVLNAAILAGMGFGAAEMKRQALFRSAGPTATGAPPPTWSAWLARQVDFLGLNYGWVNVLGMVAAAALLPLASGPAAAGAAALLLVGVLWPALFRSLAQTHHYAQWYLGPGYALALAAVWPRLKRRGASLALCALVAAALPAASSLERLIHDEQFAEAADVRALAAEPRRVLASETYSGPKQWWVSPVVQFYTDPVYKRRVLKLPADHVRGGFALFETVERFDPETDTVVVAAAPGPVAAAKAAALKRFRVTLHVASRSPAFAFLTAVEKPAAYAK